MATSGSFDFNLEVSDIIEEAYERIGEEVRSGYDARTARRSLNLLLTQWANKGYTLWTLERRSISLTQGQSRYELNDYDVDVLEVAIRQGQNDYVISRTSRHESMFIPDKSREARPTQYFVDRLTPVTIELWPVPDRAMDMIVDVFTFTEDVGSSANELALPRRFIPAMVSGLAYHLAMKKNRQLVGQMKQLYDMDFNEAIRADQETQSFTVTPRNGNNRGPRRRP
jgi:hypothetical protein